MRKNRRSALHYTHLIAKMFSMHTVCRAPLGVSVQKLLSDNRVARAHRRTKRMHSLSHSYAGNGGRYSRLVETSREVLPSLPASCLILRSVRCCAVSIEVSRSDGRSMSIAPPDASRVTSPIAAVTFAFFSVATPQNHNALAPIFFCHIKNLS